MPPVRSGGVEGHGRIRPRSAPPFRVRRPPRFRGSERYFRSSCGQEAGAPREGCASADRSTSPSFCACCAFRRRSCRVRFGQPSFALSARTAGLTGVAMPAVDWGREDQDVRPVRCRPGNCIHRPVHPGSRPSVAANENPRNCPPQRWSSEVTHLAAMVDVDAEHTFACRSPAASMGQGQVTSALNRCGTLQLVRSACSDIGLTAWSASRPGPLQLAAPKASPNPSHGPAPYPIRGAGVSPETEHA